MRHQLSVLLAIAIAASIASAYPEPEQLDPRRADHREALLEIVRQSANGKSSRAAKVLAQSGYMDDLLEILRTTSSWNTMQAVAQTRDPRTLPVLEARIRANPNDLHLVDAISFVQNPGASGVLMDLLRMHPDADQPRKWDMVDRILTAMLMNRTRDALPLLRERFASCSGSSKPDRKSAYAVTLLSLGDATGIEWMRQSLPAERLRNMCHLMRPYLDVVELEDESIMAPLLPELIAGVSDSKGTSGLDCWSVLIVLTRHNFPVGDTAWQKWYEEHKDRHPMYSRPLDRAAKLCADSFRKGIADAALRDDTIRWVDSFLHDPWNGRSAYSDFLWKFECSPRSLLPTSQKPGAPPPEWQDKAEDLDLALTVSLTSRLREPDSRIFRRDFEAINVTVCLGATARNKATKELLLEVADRACAPLAEYQESWERATRAEQDATVRGQ